MYSIVICRYLARVLNCILYNSCNVSDYHNIEVNNHSPAFGHVRRKSEFYSTNLRTGFGLIGFIVVSRSSGRSVIQYAETFNLRSFEHRRFCLHIPCRIRRRKQQPN